MNSCHFHHHSVSILYKPWVPTSVVRCSLQWDVALLRGIQVTEDGSETSGPPKYGWKTLVIGLVLLGKSTGNHGFYHQIWWAFRLKFSHHPILWTLESKPCWEYGRRIMDNIYIYNWRCKTSHLFMEYDGNFCWNVMMSPTIRWYCLWGRWRWIGGHPRDGNWDFSPGSANWDVPYFPAQQQRFLWISVL